MSAARTERERLRIFLGVFPPREVQHAAERVIERLRQPEDGVSWVRPDNLHFTLRFLGDLGEDGARRAAVAAADAAIARPAFDARLGSLGAFPSARKARVLWIGLAEGAEGLIGLARAVEEALQRKGFGRAERPFAPHLTIGRVRELGRDWSATLAGADAAVSSVASDAPIPFAAGDAAIPSATGDGVTRFRVDRVLVVHSQLSPRGSIYSVRAEVPLAG